jgi:Zn-dependent protease
MNGGIRLFRLAGIDVFLHWSWAIVAYFAIQSRVHDYLNGAWAVAEYVGLFLIVLMHEFGHALATRSVGGEARHILLWPFGGIAFVRAPMRPGAQLWGIIAGPLVNVALIAPTFAAWYFLAPNLPPDPARFVMVIAIINLALLIFNMLPIYPLDGGQALRALLWFGIGPIKSLKIASFIGLIGSGLLIAWSLSRGSIWMTVLAVMIGMECWRATMMVRQVEDQQRP